MVGNIVEQHVFLYESCMKCGSTIKWSKFPRNTFSSITCIRKLTIIITFSATHLHMSCHGTESMPALGDDNYPSEVWFGLVV